MPPPPLARGEWGRLRLLRLVASLRRRAGRARRRLGTWAIPRICPRRVWGSLVAGGVGDRLPDRDRLRRAARRPGANRRMRPPRFRPPLAGRARPRAVRQGGRRRNYSARRRRRPRTGLLSPGLPCPGSGPNRVMGCARVRWCRKNPRRRRTSPTYLRRGRSSRQRKRGANHHRARGSGQGRAMLRPTPLGGPAQGWGITWGEGPGRGRRHQHPRSGGRQGEGQYRLLPRSGARVRCSRRRGLAAGAVLGAGQDQSEEVVGSGRSRPFYRSFWQNRAVQICLPAVLGNPRGRGRGHREGRCLSPGPGRVRQAGRLDVRRL
mmetsp:Transcript_24361/g.68298  ORF Transcript_24361/g.68298 Transcript_24361/m.68298 type:complete len:320 (+) Transcript_24361:4129-5088(+)